jgi:hypothetical protein
MGAANVMRFVPTATGDRASEPRRFGGTPTRSLPHPEKVRREQRWIVFGAITFAVIGTGIAVQSRMR